LRPRFLIASFLVAGGGPLWPGGARADIITTKPEDTKFYGDDTHTSVLHPLVPVMGANDNGVDQPGGLINAGTAAFMKANPADGTGPSGQGWMFHWLSTEKQAEVDARFNGTYDAFVVSVPTNVQAGGQTYNDPKSDKFRHRYDQHGADNMNELGGAILNVTSNYQVPANSPSHTYSLHWIQAFADTDYGENAGPALDLGRTGGGKTPFYDASGGSAGTLAGNPDAWFLDIPNAFELEYENPRGPVVSTTFQVVLALDDQTTDDKGIVQNNVFFVGGFQWGFTYTAVETLPEPSPLSYLSLVGMLGALGYAWRRRRRPA
jgi:hypothetical protein